MTTAASADDRAARTDWLALGAAGVTLALWASAFVGIRAAGHDFAPATLAFGRLLVGSVVLGSLVAARREPLPGRKDVPLIVLCGLLWFGAYNVLLNAGERRVDAGTAAMLVNVGPVLVALLAGFLLGEGFPRALFLGCAVAFGGVAVIAVATSSGGSRGGVGTVLCVAAAFGYAGGVVTQKVVLRGVSALQTTFLCCLVATVALSFATPSLIRELGDARSTNVAWLVYLGALPTAVAFTTWAYALARTGAGRLAATTYLVPLLSILLGWAFLGETPPGLAFVGGAICLAGVAVARAAARRRERARLRRYDRPGMQEYVLSELDSGERLITERVQGVRSVALGFWIGAGSRDEPEAKAGVSHFIEHLLFKGTREYDALQIAEIFDEMGGELNAATSREHTVVYARVPDRHLEHALDVMADMVFSPAFADIDSEREVVLEEIAMVEDAPQDLVHDLLSDAVFSGQPLGRPVIGRAEVISSISRRSIAAYHRGAYVAGNVVLAAAGRLEHDRLLGLLERAARQRVEPPARRTRVRSPLVREPGPGLRFQQKDTEQFHVCVGAPGLARSDRRRFAASLLDAILGGSASSRLFQEIREKRGMAYSVYSFGSQYTDTGLVGIYVGTREENLGPCLEIVAEEVADIAAGNLRDRELERAKENLKGRIALSMESTSSRMSRLGRSLITDTELLSLDRVIAEIDAVGPAMLAELAGVILDPARLSAAGIGPSEERFREAVERVHPGLAAAA